jgi:hypothetical protein
MTEAEWLACTDSCKMFELFRATRLDPRLRRFAVECCRRVRHLIAVGAFRAAADAGEAFADDPRNKLSTIKCMAKACIEARLHRRQYAISADRHQLHAADAAIATCACTDWHAAFNAMRAAAQAANQANANCFDSSELQYQAALLRCIFGPFPFRSLILDLTWITQTVELLANAINEDRAFDHLPVLADALEEAGCTDSAILDHCRGPGPHTRGCWVVDLILAKDWPRPAPGMSVSEKASPRRTALEAGPAGTRPAKFHGVAT